MTNIIQAFAVKNACYIANKPMAPKGIVLHSTGANNPYLKRYIDNVAECGLNQYGNHFNTYHPGGKDIGPHTYVDVNKDYKCDVCGGRQVCVHDFIGYDKNKIVRVAHILPYNVASWGCGGKYNYDPTGHIQIEICEDNLSNKTYFQQAFDVAAEHCADLCKKYNLNPSTIVSHYEAYKKGCASNHGDCDQWLKKFGKTMNDFRRVVQDRMDGKATSIVDEPVTYKDVSYEVKITAKGTLNVRKGPGYEYPVVTRLKEGTIQTVSCEAVVNGVTWGKVTAGWICLTGYTEKIKPLKAGSKVKIKSGAVYGGLNSSRGKAVPSTLTSLKRTYTISRIQTNKNTEEALIKELYSWIATSSLISV